MDQAKRDEMFGILCEMSDRQVDPKAKQRLRAFVGRTNEEIKDELLGLIDDIVHASWTSGFEIRCLHAMWCSIGGSDKELKERNANLVINEETRAKYKWTTR